MSGSSFLKYQIELVHIQFGEGTDTIIFGKVIVRWTKPVPDHRDAHRLVCHHKKLHLVVRLRWLRGKDSTKPFCLFCGILSIHTARSNLSNSVQTHAGEATWKNTDLTHHFDRSSHPYMTLRSRPTLAATYDAQEQWTDRNSPRPMFTYGLLQLQQTNQ